MHLTLPGQHKPEWGGQYGRNFHLREAQAFATSSSSKTISFIEVYPNPVTDEAFLLVKMPESVDNSILSVYDTKGALMTQLNPKDTNGFVRLNTTGYASGMYLVELYFEDVKVDNTKFIVNQ